MKQKNNLIWVCVLDIILLGVGTFILVNNRKIVDEDSLVLLLEKDKIENFEQLSLKKKDRVNLEVSFKDRNELNGILYENVQVFDVFDER